MEKNKSGGMGALCKAEMQALIDSEEKIIIIDPEGEYANLAKILQLPEYMEYRCCMCPQDNLMSSICPGIEGSLHPQEEPCRFVKSYVDEQGNEYSVIETEGLCKRRYKGCCLKVGNGRTCAGLKWRDSFDEAQGDLNKYAGRKGWKEYEWAST